MKTHVCLDAEISSHAREFLVEKCLEWLTECLLMEDIAVDTDIVGDRPTNLTDNVSETAKQTAASGIKDSGKFQSKCRIICGSWLQYDADKKMMCCGLCRDLKLTNSMALVQIT